MVIIIFHADAERLHDGLRDVYIGLGNKLADDFNLYILTGIGRDLQEGSEKLAADIPAQAARAAGKAATTDTDRRAAMPVHTFRLNA